MKIRFAFVLISFLLGMTVGRAQEFSCRLGLGGMLPIERTFMTLELSDRFAPHFSLTLAGEVSRVESNISPMLIVDVGSGFSLSAGFGWGHKFQRLEVDDHNFHTYTLGIVWSKPIGSRWSFFVGPSLYWRSYQAHIGLHRGALRLCAGVSFSLSSK